MVSGAPLTVEVELAKVTHAVGIQSSALGNTVIVEAATDELSVNGSRVLGAPPWTTGSGRIIDDLRARLERLREIERVENSHNGTAKWSLLLIAADSRTLLSDLVPVMYTAGVARFGQVGLIVDAAGPAPFDARAWPMAWRDNPQPALYVGRDQMRGILVERLAPARDEARQLFACLMTSSGTPPTEPCPPERQTLRMEFELDRTNLRGSGLGAAAVLRGAGDVVVSGDPSFTVGEYLQVADGVLAGGVNPTPGMTTGSSGPVARPIGSSSSTVTRTWTASEVIAFVMIPDG